MSVTREKELVGIECKGRGGGDFNRVDRKASKEVMAEKARRSGNFEA